jgi:hypothetical protein
MKWSILICTLPDRYDYLKRLQSILVPQTSKYPGQVEIRYHDAGVSTPTGTKRNDLISVAEGEYFSFIDDDDVPASTYVRDILKALESNPDVVTFNGWMTTDSLARVDFIIKLGEAYEAREGKYYRWPNHLTVMKKSAVESVKFQDIWQGEDYRWCKEIRDKGLLKTSVHIEKDLYWYDYVSNK